MKFVLIVMTFFVYKGSTVSMVEFNDMNSCQDAKRWIEQAAKEGGASIKTTCATDLYPEWALPGPGPANPERRRAP
ncbi:MAG TPA: hypothetical protein VGU20_16710 [Stellaceae bacterium]|nr:hypothetical protein [Stellaceae bacterium]